MDSNVHSLDKYEYKIGKHYPHAICYVRLEYDQQGKPEDFTIIYCNDAMAEIEGLTRQQLQNRRFYEVFPNGDRILLNDFYEAASEGKVFSFDKITEGNGRSFHVEIYPSDEKNVCTCVLRDINEEVLEKQRRNEQLSIFQVLSRNYDNIYMADLDKKTAKILKLETTYLQLASLRDAREFPYDAVVEQWVSTGVHPDDQDMMREALRTDHVREVLAEKDESTGNYRSVHDGETHYFQYTLYKMSDDGNNVLLCMKNIDGIIEEHFAAEKRIREQEEQHQKEMAETIQKLEAMRDILGATKMGTWSIRVMDDQLPAMEADEQMKELLDIAGLELTPEETYNAWFQNIADDAVESIEECMDHIKNSGRYEVTYLWNHPTLGGRYVRGGGTGQRIEGGYILRGYHYDVDDMVREQKRQENALRDALLVARQATRAKTTFLSNMSHDIRTPMNAIIGYTALARTHMGDQEQLQDYLKKIHTSGTHLLGLINEILDMSRIESGTVKLEESAVHIPDVMHDLRSMIQGQIEDKHQNLYIDTMDVIHEDVITDKLRLSQILLNIIGNANKYTQDGGNIIVRVTEKPCTIKDYTTYEFRVKDTGTGMSPEFVEHIFDSFSRERSSTACGVQGTGLGMSITKSIVDMMNGTITVESEQGVGSEFVVTINFKLADHAVRTIPIPELQGSRALVVDDDVHCCQSVSKMLGEIGMRPDWCTSGREAVIRAKEASELQKEYKAYIIDYRMPEMNGIETVRQIRKVISDDIPIIVLTAYDWTDIEEEARAAGVTAFVTKPLFMSELRNVLTLKVEEEPEPVQEPDLMDYHGKRVLLVEDNDLNREIATAILTEEGILVDGASDGIEAVRVMQEAPDDRYDLIFMDIQMPKMDGYVATRIIRALKSKKKACIPIVAMTANAFDEDKKKAFAAGMNGHIAKPISIDAINQVLSQIKILS